jgi:hypothetical protein
MSSGLHWLYTQGKLDPRTYESIHRELTTIKEAEANLLSQGLELFQSLRIAQLSKLSAESDKESIQAMQMEVERAKNLHQALIFIMAMRKRLT